MEKKNPFKVPENYFQDFKLEIMDKLPDKKINTKKININSSILRWSAVAAVIAVFTFVGLEFMNNSESSLSQSSSVTGLESEEIIVSDQQYASLQNDYYLFLEDQATDIMYNDTFDVDDL